MSKFVNKATLAKLLLVLVTIAWGSSFVILKDTINNLGGGHFTFFVLALRFIISAIVLIAIFWKKVKQIKKSTLLKGAMLGLILFVAYGIQTIGLRYTTPSKNAFLTSVYCVLVPFLGWLILKIKPKFRHVIAGAFCLLGIAFVSLIGKNEHVEKELLGDGLSIFCGLFYALQIIYIAKGTANEDAMQLLIVEISTVAILFSCLSAIVEFPTHYKELSISFEEGWKILYLAIVCTCFAQFGQMIAQKYASPISVALIFCLEAVFGVIFEILLGDAKLTVFIVIGFFIIFLSQLISEVGVKKIMQLFKGKNKGN